MMKNISPYGKFLLFFFLVLLSGKGAVKALGLLGIVPWAWTDGSVESVWPAIVLLVSTAVVLLICGMLAVLAKWSGLGKYVDGDAPWKGAVLVGLSPAVLLAIPGLWFAWEQLVGIILEESAKEYGGIAFFPWPRWMVALVAAAVVLGLVGALKLSALVVPKHRGEWRLAVWWVLGGGFAWAFWINSGGFVDGKGAAPVTWFAGLSALCFALGVGAWHRDTLRALSRGGSWLAGWLEAAMVFSLTYFFLVSLVAMLGLSEGRFSPAPWIVVVWIASGIGPFVVLALLKRWFGLAPPPSPQGGVNVNDKAALALWRARQRGS